MVPSQPRKPPWLRIPLTAETTPETVDQAFAQLRPLVLELIAGHGPGQKSYLEVGFTVDPASDPEGWPGVVG